MSPSTGPSSQIPDRPGLSIKGFSFASNASTKSLPISTKPRTPISSTLGKRPRTALQDNSDDDTDDRAVKHEVVTAFDASGAVAAQTERSAQKVLVIPRMKNRDWREEIRRGRPSRNLLPPEVQAQRNSKVIQKAKPVDITSTADDESKWGLTIMRNNKPEENSIGGTDIASVVVASEITVGGQPSVEVSPEKTDDERAIEALMGIENEKGGQKLVIPAAESDDNNGSIRTKEEDAFKRAMRSAPDVSTLEDYERVPVEEFGAALLRGMGWKEGARNISLPKDVKRRQNLLGLGAKELKGAEELGAWVQRSDPKRLNRRGPGGDHRPKANEYREAEQRRKEERDVRYGGSHRRDREYDREKERKHRY